MSDSPWNAYGRLPRKAQSTNAADRTDDKDPVAGMVDEVARGREQLDRYLHGVMREYFEIHCGSAGYRKIVDDALTPSTRPESIEERLNRLAREDRARRPGGGSRNPRPPSR